jgi:AcrR family transcriptional regulator
MMTSTPSDTVATTMPTEPGELAVLQPETTPPLRADAARNRAKVLAAAERLFAECGAEHVTMDAVAAAAGVGKGTLFRGFGDRSGLAHALLSERTRCLQDAMIRGPAPLGPGAPAEERLVAFGQAYVDVHAPHLDLLVAAERGSRLLSAPYLAFRLHVALLVRAAAPDLDADFAADVLMSALSGEMLVYYDRERGMSQEQIAAAWAELVRRVLSPR